MPGSQVKQRSKASIGTRGKGVEARRAIPAGLYEVREGARVKGGLYGALRPHTSVLFVGSLPTLV